ncbi:hypothetical protein A6U96_07520 [Agrobacterium tumefaciens]|nr:hypothetical protein A6U96_07520 [Agrobacterium tumefaciens]
MTDEITNPSLAGFLTRVGLTASTMERVIAIDRAIAAELERDELDAEGCAELVLEAADLIANAGPLGFDWSAWGDDDDEEFEEERDHV